MDLREINQIYNAIEVKDMPRHEFVKEMQRLTSQANVNRDLKVILGQKQTMAIRGAREKQKIDKVIENAR